MVAVSVADEEVKHGSVYQVQQEGGVAFERLHPPYDAAVVRVLLPPVVIKGAGLVLSVTMASVE